MTGRETMGVQLRHVAERGILRIKTAASWIDIGPRVTGSMDEPLHSPMFTAATTLDGGARETPADLLAALYAGTIVVGRTAPVRERE